MLAQELAKISRRFIGRVKFTSQDLDHFSHTSGFGDDGEWCWSDNANGAEWCWSDDADDGEWCWADDCKWLLRLVHLSWHCLWLNLLVTNN